MASLDWTQLWWNGKLSSSADLLYYDKINVDVVNPPYARRDRLSSYFLKTRKWYVADVELAKAFYEYTSDADKKQHFNVTDIQIVWDSACSKDEGTVYYMWVNEQWTRKMILTRQISWGCLQPNITPLNQKTTGWEFPQGCTCTDNKFFKTSYVKWEPRTTVVYPDTDTDLWIRWTDWIQINKVEWWAMRWYFTTKAIIDWEAEWAWWRWTNPIQAWDYLVIYSSTNWEWDWFCWQVRTITGYNKATWMLSLDSAWSWFQDWEKEVKGNNLSFQIFSQWWETLWFTSWRGIDIITTTENSLTMCDFWNLTGNAECIIDSCATTDRIFVLYDNWWIHFWGYGRDKFFDSWDAMYAWVDKINIECYRNYILAMGRRNMAIWVASTDWWYYQMYNQSTTIWLKNRYSYWEYNGDFLFVSNDNRLLALKVNTTQTYYWTEVLNTWPNMLSFEDVWQYINPYLKAMLPWDECHIGVDNNQLRIFLNTVSDVDKDTEKSRTLIFKYDTTFSTWTVDQLKYAIIWWVYEGIFFWDAVYWRKWYSDIGVYTSGSFEENKGSYNVRISAFLLENEDNWMSTTDATLDLFRLASLQKLVVLLWMWKYDGSNTQIKITEYRNWFWYDYVIDSLEWNTWLYNVWAAYEWESIEVSDCVLADIRDNSKALRTTCPEWHKIQNSIAQVIWCDYEHPYQLTDHNVCINDEVYKMAPTMPLSITLWDQEHFNSEIYVELVSNSDDVINFWWFLAELMVAPIGYKWWDWEYAIEVDSGC